MANKIVLVKNGIEEQVDPKEIKGLILTCLEGADNNVIKIHAPYIFDKLSIMLCGCGNTVEIGRNSEIRMMGVLVSKEANNSSLKIGENFFCVGCELHFITQRSSISIGKDCLLSSDIIISTDDGHPVFDIYTHKMINKGGLIDIADHVWLGFGVTVCKNVSIAPNIIVGANSIVTKKLDKSNSVYAGSPAKLIKTGVDFSKKVIYRYEQSLKEMNNVGE